MGGVALGAVGGALVSPLEAAAHMSKLSGLTSGSNDYYPPGLDGLRGSHEGSFEVSHALAREGKTWPRPASQTDQTYDLVVVGGGISGLAAAWLFRKQAGPDTRILIIENHDDFGGHAKRNEFEVDGRTLIGYGGSQSMEGPSQYSKATKQVLKDISIEVEHFYQHYDQGFYKRRNLEGGIYFNQHGYGTDKLLPDPFQDVYNAGSSKSARTIIGEFPVAPATRDALIAMLENDVDYLPGLSDQLKINKLRKMSYVDYIQSHAGIPAEGAELLRDKFKGYWALAWDAMSALEGVRLGMPGTSGLSLGGAIFGADYNEEPYIFHFPDGNAGIARSLVRKLVPGALPGTTMEDLVTSRANYAMLDEEGSPVRIRLNSTAVDVRHSKDGSIVDVTYIKSGAAHRVQAKHIILACDNAIIPRLCPEVPEAQREAIAWPTRAPLVYTNIVLRNWQAFDKLGFERIFIPKADLMYSMTLDFPVSMGDYNFSAGPDQPIIVHGTVIPAVPLPETTPQEQFRLGRQRLYELSFEDFENDIYAQMDGALGGGGFDAERDIAGITVNRWPHGYAYEYNELFDPVDWSPEKGPHIAGRAQIGRISIANSDASAYAYINGAIDAAARAVDEQLG